MSDPSNETMLPPRLLVIPRGGDDGTADHLRSLVSLTKEAIQRGSCRRGTRNTLLITMDASNGDGTRSGTSWNVLVQEPPSPDQASTSLPMDDYAFLAAVRCGLDRPIAGDDQADLVRQSLNAAASISSCQDEYVTAHAATPWCPGMVVGQECPLRGRTIGPSWLSTTSIDEPFAAFLPDVVMANMASGDLVLDVMMSGGSRNPLIVEDGPMSGWRLPDLPGSVEAMHAAVRLREARDRHATGVPCDPDGGQDER